MIKCKYKVQCQCNHTDSVYFESDIKEVKSNIKQYGESHLCRSCILEILSANVNIFSYKEKMIIRESIYDILKNEKNYSVYININDEIFKIMSDFSIKKTNKINKKFTSFYLRNGIIIMIISK